MAYSLGLTLYNLANRRDASVAMPRPARPAGRLVWMHAPDADAARPLLELARRLVEDDGLLVLITCAVQLRLPDGVMQDAPPYDAPAEAKAFLDHWQPEMAVLAEGELRPSLLNCAANKSLPIILVEGKSPHLLREREGWYPGLARSLLGHFSHVLTLDETAARAFRKAGAAPSVVEVAGRMENESAVLPHTEAERVSMAEILATRPVWLVAGLPAAEEDAIIAAHRAALRLSHRLLLIVVPQDAGRADALAQKMEKGEGWQVALRAADQDPEPESEVLIADSSAELGLWYRLAPITYLGGSLLGDGCLHNPLEGAALGSALIAGPNSGPFVTAFDQLTAARALRAIGSAGELADAVSELLAPDRAARLANAAWGVASDGAEVTDRVITLIRRIIDGDS
jgi:3-deoxy-D-manno-octulosonic-acid transferase